MGGDRKTNAPVSLNKYLYIMCISSILLVQSCVYLYARNILTDLSLLLSFSDTFVFLTIDSDILLDNFNICYIYLWFFIFCLFMNILNCSTLVLKFGREI